MKIIRCLLALPLLVLLGCPGDATVRNDQSQTQDTNYQVPDWPQQYPDSPRMPDFYPQTPDTQPPQPDFWYWPPDTGYTGSPFGCQRDSDCFGLKCCETPWGVKLCAEVCQK